MSSGNGIVIGVDIPGFGPLPSGMPGLPGLPGSAPPDPFGGLGSMLGSALGAPGGIPGLPGGIPGFGPPQAPQPGGFLPLTQQVVTGILGLIASARGPQVFSAGPANVSVPNQAATAAQAAQLHAMDTALNAMGIKRVGPSTTPPGTAQTTVQKQTQAAMTKALAALGIHRK